MAHEIDMSNDRANVAFIGDIPWHGLGVNLDKEASIETWKVQAGLDWDAHVVPIEYEVEDLLYAVPNKNVIYRNDTKAALGIVSDRYRIVQPSVIMDTYKELTEDFGCQMEVAGSLKGGKVIWALASTGQSEAFMGVDEVKGYLLLTTSFDGSSSTTAKFTSIRVVCNNTLEISLSGSNSSAVKIPHSREYKKEEVMGELGMLPESWDSFLESTDILMNKKVTQTEAQKWLIDTFGDCMLPFAAQPNTRTFQRVMGLYGGKGMGSDLITAKGTAWGLVNAATQLIDHNEHARSSDSRLSHAWVGAGSIIKSKAFTNALAIV